MHSPEEVIFAEDLAVPAEALISKGGPTVAASDTLSVPGLVEDSQEELASDGLIAQGTTDDHIDRVVWVGSSGRLCGKASLACGQTGWLAGELLRSLMTKVLVSLSLASGLNSLASRQALKSWKGRFEGVK